MKLKLLYCICLLHVAAIGRSQILEQNLATWTKTNPVEKLYLHLDRESYYSGQTIWFKGYFMANFVPSGASSTMYAELVDENANIIARKVFPAYLGCALGQVDIPENTATGNYQLRAYSPVMLNQPGFIYSKAITIFGKEKKNNQKAATTKTTVTFFPEGGNMVTGLLNTIAFKATDENGYPINISGNIKNQKGDIVTSITTTHDGMGQFAIIPLNNDIYTAVLQDGQQYTLPKATANGIALNVRNSAKGKHFRLQYASADPVFQPAYMIGQMANEVIFRQNFTAGKKEINGSIETGNFYSGILHITIFNKDDMPLAERITFIDNKEYLLPGILQTDTVNNQDRKRNRFTISLKDTIIGNFSIAVTDADYEETANRPQNIYSGFLLNSDIKGYVHNPAWYFLNNNDAAKNALDLVMMTNGWTRFKWSDVAKNTLPPPQFKDPAYINLTGKINIEGTRKPLADRDVIMMLKPSDTTLGKRGLPKMLKTDAEGNFELDSMIFFDHMQILFSEVRGNKSKFIKVKLAGDSINRRYAIPPVQIPFKDTTPTTVEEKMQNAYGDYLKGQGTLLENVIVRARQRSEVDKMDEEYTSGLFSGGINSRTLDLRNEIYGGSIFQYLQGRVAGLTVTGTPGDYNISYRGGIGGSNVALFLDEILTDADMIENIPVSQIAMVKLIPNSVATVGGGTALAIYMKKGTELNRALESPTDIINYNGYSIIKEFYSPDYDRQPEAAKADDRLTLHWQPDIFVANVNPQIPIIFYNNDRTKRFKIVAEGVTNDGRMLMIEKIIEPGK